LFTPEVELGVFDVFSRVSSKTVLFSVEVHINKNKWLVMGIYKPPSMSDNDFSTLFY
jgi:hypothetical protein